MFTRASVGSVLVSAAIGLTAASASWAFRAIFVTQRRE
jgi:hypothetical protein